MTATTGSMNAYYDERAGEYDDIYIGKGPASINNPDAYKNDVKNVLEIIASMESKGSVFDIPCGTAFWMPSYYKDATNIHLFDQSQNMLKKAAERAQSLNCHERCTFTEADILSLENLNTTADFALVGFFLSHLVETEENKFFEWLKKHVKDRIVIIDSTWSEERAKLRGKTGNQTRKLNNGTEFSVFKKYYDENDIRNLGSACGLQTETRYFGETMFVAEMKGDYYGE